MALNPVRRFLRFGVPRRIRGKDKNLKEFYVLCLERLFGRMGSDDVEYD